MLNLIYFVFFLAGSKIGNSFQLNNNILKRGIQSTSLGVAALDAASQNSLSMSSKEKPPTKEGYAWLKEQLEKLENDKKERPPPLYEPGPYSQKLLAASAYFIPVVDSLDLGKYMFEAYPEVGSVFSTAFGPLAAIYNGVPFLSFSVFFFMIYFR